MCIVCWILGEIWGIVETRLLARLSFVLIEFLCGSSGNEKVEGIKFRMLKVN